MNESILGIRVDITTYLNSTNLVLEWANNGKSRYLCAANVHLVMEAFDDITIKKSVNAADLVVPDGMPLLWMLRLMGHSIEQRVYGPTLMLRVLEAAAEQSIPVGLYGGAPDVMERLIKNLNHNFPALRIVYCYSPPFRELLPEEERSVLRNIYKSQARILFIGLGCPKQELWMARHVGKIQAVMLGVGAAFDFHSGNIKQAPAWLQNKGLEWLFRLLIEPGRLWKRYLRHNPRFVALVMTELAFKRGPQP